MRWRGFTVKACETCAALRVNTQLCLIMKPSAIICFSKARSDRDGRRLETGGLWCGELSATSAGNGGAVSGIARSAAILWVLMGCQGVFGRRRQQARLVLEAGSCVRRHRAEWISPVATAGIEHQQQRAHQEQQCRDSDGCGRLRRSHHRLCRRGWTIFNVNV